MKQANALPVIAIGSFIVGLVLWFGGACLVLTAGSDTANRAAPAVPGAAPPAPRAVTPTPTPTRLPDRTSCAEIRGTEYRSEAERQFFIQNCATTP